MKIHLNIAFFLVICFTLLFSFTSEAQSIYTKNKIDSSAIQNRINNEYARRDSMIAAMRQKRSADSLARIIQKQKLQQYRDSLVAARISKRKADSIARLELKNKLIEERRIKDSTDLAVKRKTQDSLAAIQFKLDSIKHEEQYIANKIAAEKRRIQDSLLAVRLAYNDSLKEARLISKTQRDEWNKYKNSKHYKDSVAARKKEIADNLKQKRQTELTIRKEKQQHFNDSIFIARKMYNDSLTLVRHQHNDSIATHQRYVIDSTKAFRKTYTDSVVTARNILKDSLNAKRKLKDLKAKEAEEAALAKAKKKNDLSLSVKVHEDKKEAWTNEKLLKRKWSLPRRIYQNTVTRYNYYYNAKRKYRESTKTLTKNNHEDFSQPISIYPFDVQKSGSTVASDMDSVIKKCSFSTQIHDPRSKWFDNLYFLMGKGSYTKSDYESAITTFQFVANEYKDAPKKSVIKNAPLDSNLSIASVEKRKGIRKLRHQPIRNEALIWLAKSYIMAEQYSEAQSLLGTLEKDRNFPKRLKPDLYITKASLDIEQKNTTEAIASLTEALKQKLDHKQSSRLEFLLGQLYRKEKDYVSSTEHLKKSIHKKTKPEMDFFSKLYIAENAAYGGGEKAESIKQLEKIISDPKFAKFKSQALIALAAIEATDNPEKAITLLKKSIADPENKEPIQKATAFAYLGKLYYNNSDYEPAKAAYDSASFYGSNPPIENINEVNTRKTVLGDIVTYLHIIHTQDSLLMLSQKSEKEQKAIAKKELDRIKKLLEEQKSTETKVETLIPNNSTKSNWYFYKTDLIEKGAKEFTQKWGKRKLEDNWRRIAVLNSNSNAMENIEEQEQNAGDIKAIGTDLYTLLSYIPKTPAKVDAAKIKIMDAYYGLGLTYFSQLSDYKKSIGAFDTLIDLYPTTSYKAQSYYGLYLDYNKLGETTQATKYKNLLNKEFGESIFSQIASNPEYLNEIKNKEKYILHHYDSTYALYKVTKYTEALSQVEFAKATYKNHALLPKYLLVEAISYAGLKNFVKCKEILTSIIANYVNTPEQIRSTAILNYLLAHNTDSLTAKIDSNTVLKTIITNPDNTKSEDSLEASVSFTDLRKSEGSGHFEYEPNSPHFVLVFIKNVDGRTMALKSALSDYNLMKHGVSEYSTGLNLFTAQQAVVTVQEFSNHIFAKQYMNELKGEKNIFTQFQKNEYEICIISKANQEELLKTRDILGYLKFYKQKYK